MTKDEAKMILARAFAALTPAKQSRLRRAASGKRPVLCGKWASLYTSIATAPPGGA